MKSFQWKGSYYILLLLALNIFQPAFSQKDRPNIIYIMADDLGYSDLSGYGRKDYSTPNLDKLASQGLKFVNAYSASPLCTPSRTGFMTGRYPARHSVGLREPLVMNKKDSLVGLSPDQPTLALLLKTAGYETALIGKWHLGFLPKFSPNNNGFDYFYGIHSGAADYISHRGERLGHDLYENDQPVYPKGYLTDLLKNKAVEFLEKKHDKPFFLSMQFNAPHWPWQGPGDSPYPDTMNLRAGGSQEVYAIMMKSLDDAVKAILETLDKQNLAANTVVIFTSDNGGDKFSDMGPLSGGKPQLWEGGIKVPAFVRWPGKIKVGITEQPIITLDWTATILDLAKGKPSSQFPPDGRSLLPFLTGERNLTPRTFYWRLFQRNQQKAMRDGDWKWLQDEKGEYLFNIAKDPGEKNNLKEKETAIFDALKKKYEQWESTVLKPIPLGG